MQTKKRCYSPWIHQRYRASRSRVKPATRHFRREALSTMDRRASVTVFSLPSPCSDLFSRSFCVRAWRAEKCLPSWNKRVHSWRWYVSRWSVRNSWDATLDVRTKDEDSLSNSFITVFYLVSYCLIYCNTPCATPFDMFLNRSINTPCTFERTFMASIGRFEFVYQLNGENIER